MERRHRNLQVETRNQGVPLSNIERSGNWTYSPSDVLLCMTRLVCMYGQTILFTRGLLFGRLLVLARDRFPSGIPHPHLLGDRSASIFLLASGPDDSNRVDSGIGMPVVVFADGPFRKGAQRQGLTS